MGQPTRLTMLSAWALLLCGAVGVSAAARASRAPVVVIVQANAPGPRIDRHIAGASMHSAGGQVLTAAAMDAHNTFEHPDAVGPIPFQGVRQGGRLLFRLPPKSVAVVAVY